MSIVAQFLEELENGTFPIESAEDVMTQLSPRMTVDERAKANGYLTQLKARLRLKQQQKKTYLQAIPKGLLRDYLQLAQISEAPDSFHLFSILAVVSHLIGSKVWFGMGHRRLLAPISCFLVSPAGQARRSSAIRMAVDIGRAAGAVVIQDAATPEGLVVALSQTPAVLVVADEAATFLSKREYMQDMPAVLCTLLDCPERYQRNLKNEVLVVNNPVTNAIIGCAPEWMLNSLPKAAMGGGMLSRLIMVYEAGRKALIPLPDDVINQEEVDRVKENISTRIRKLTDDVSGKMTYGVEAKKVFTDFYYHNDEEMRHNGDKMAIYFSRKPDHVHRLVMTLLVLQDKKTLVVDVETLRLALTILSLVEEHMEMAYRQAGLEKPGQLQQRVISALERGGGELTRSDLLRRVSDCMTAKELSIVIDTLIQLEEVVIGRRVSPSKLVETYRLVRL
jgi:hypothetical protein